MPQCSGQWPTINEVLRFLHNMIMASQLILGDCSKREEWPWVVMLRGQT